MTGIRAFVTGMGIISPLGRGTAGVLDTLKKNSTSLSPLTLFTAASGQLPVGEIGDFPGSGPVPRAHALALIAAQEALGDSAPPDAIIIGSTTGGMTLTEDLLEAGEKNPELYRFHGTGTIAEYLAEQTGCMGPVITVSTACSSGTAVIKLALEMLRSGRASRVLAGGTDSLCRLTYYGFHSLQLIDPTGSRPLDRDRRGMSVAEGAAMLLIESATTPPERAVAEVLGAGLSCDAYHPAAPHPEGRGAVQAMAAALRDASCNPSDIDYINLHGTGTKENDLAEARAVNALFADSLPPVSSIKGATGHSLAAAGAIEAVISSLCIAEGWLPANTGFLTPDPDLGLVPLVEPLSRRIDTVLSNSFGFGGNNASVVLSRPGNSKGRKKPGQLTFDVAAVSCITGAGDLSGTLAALDAGRTCAGVLPLSSIRTAIPLRDIRRLKRLPQTAIFLAEAAAGDREISSVFFSTGFGPLTETHDFLTKLFETSGQFTSPTDFIGSVHNAPAGQIAIRHGAKGPSLAATGGACSFEQALYSLELMAEDVADHVLLVGADEYHPVLTPLFDPPGEATPSDGGAALLLKKNSESRIARIRVACFERGQDNPGLIASMMEKLGGPERIRETFAAVFLGIPLSMAAACGEQASELENMIGGGMPFVFYRGFTGEHCSASAVACALAACFVKSGGIPSGAGGREIEISGKGICMIGLGRYATAIEVLP